MFASLDALRRRSLVGIVGSLRAPPGGALSALLGRAETKVSLQEDSDQEMKRNWKERRGKGHHGSLKRKPRT